MRGVPRAGLVGGVAAVIIVVDQLSKHWALRRLGDFSTIEVVGSLQLRLTWNTGTAFSLGDDLNLGPIIAVLALLVVGWLLWSGHSARRPGAVAAGLVAGGAVGNLIDRALRSGPNGQPVGFMGGAVVDFVDLQWWPVFNVADAGIVVGAFLLVVVSMFEPRTDAPGDDPPAGDDG
ncbi:signal peptidase II [Iamia sp.]|uniref:signal peptidase II n=1 Tax=Iamia sp. TaxID=2722710 RepID=UPI002C77BA7F|nr:signal peptidase II [Iamia sp.]HXH56437.1 signal peptidase II [Iamia sp.]